ncbi:hypothetical protein CM19_04325 [Candidatus Acidianus copahuensis]|uniref:Putative antitoxin CM19_04325 n=1 Tax=Candidatus Acidianus copahuensis TaxID=1160895 RepID=A0A031LR55_9CREN|nr:antitoxin VapB family protein [Candidatus Acidianus copahuensis]EZQ10225.1 hypothetical protein CM19_04325 [Candidatus Acidianus copahuensis]
MATKTITITEEAYNALLSLKGRDESFSELMIRLVKSYSKRNIEELAGRWSEMTDDEVEMIFNNLRRAWKEWSVNV